MARLEITIRSNRDPGADTHRLLASALSQALGLQPVARNVVNGRESIYLQSGQAVVICSANRRDAWSNSSSDGVGEGERSVRVGSLGFQVDDLNAAAAHLAAKLHSEGFAPPVIEPDGTLKVCLPSHLGPLELRFLRSKMTPSDILPSGTPCPTFCHDSMGEATQIVRTPVSGVIGIDHVAINVGDVPRVSGTLRTLTEWVPFRKFTEEALLRPLTALTLGSATAEGLLTVVQPTTADSIFQKTLEANGGASVHHIALRYRNLLNFAGTLEAKGVWRTMPPPDNEYYRSIQSLAKDFMDDRSFEMMKRYGMLLDFEGDCAIIQVFLPCIDIKLGVFFELIERLHRLDDSEHVAEPLPLPGCGGFGDLNVRHLYDCLVQGVLQAPLICREQGLEAEPERMNAIAHLFTTAEPPL